MILKKKTLSFVIAMSVFTTSIAPVGAQTIYLEPIKSNSKKQNTLIMKVPDFNKDIFSDELNDLILETYKHVVNYNKTDKIEHLDNAIKSFSRFNQIKTFDEHLLMEDEKHEGYAIMLNLYYSIRNSIYNIYDKTIRAEKAVLFGNQMFISWKKDKVSTLGLYIFLLSDENDIDEIQEWLDHLDWLRRMYALIDGPGGVDDDTIPPIEDDGEGGSGNGSGNGNGNGNGSGSGNGNGGGSNGGNGSGNQSPQLPPMSEILPPKEDSNDDIIDNSRPTTSDSVYESTDYKKIGNICYQVVTHYDKNGNITNIDKVQTSKLNYVYCGIYDYVGLGGYASYSAIVDWDYILEDQNPEGTKSIHYTLNKRSKSAYYYNTGIVATAEDTVSYNQLKDAIYQVAVQAQGDSLDDNTRSLSIIDGKPIVLYSEKDVYSKEEVEQIFSDFENIGMNIMDSAESKPYPIENVLLAESLNYVIVDDIQYELSENLSMHEDYIVVPIEEIVNILGAKTRFSGDTLIITKDETTIKIKPNTVNYSVNGESYKFNTPVVIENKNYIGEIADIASLLEFDAIWDSDTGELYFNNIYK